jgi:hypothetical protein
MSEDRDDRIAQFLRKQAPAARDPVFRLKVLERREQRQFQRRMFTMLAGLLVILLVSTFVIGMGSSALKTTTALVIGTTLGSAYFAFRGQFLRILRRFSI